MSHLACTHIHKYLIIKHLQIYLLLDLVWHAPVQLVLFVSEVLSLGLSYTRIPKKTYICLQLSCVKYFPA